MKKGFMFLVVIVAMPFYFNAKSETQVSHKSSLHWAILGGRNDEAKDLIEEGKFINKEDSLGNTPLHEAAYKNNLEICKLLVAKGADVNAKTKDGTTPLGKSLSTRAWETARFLIKNGASLNVKMNDGTTLLGKALSVGAYDYSFRGPLYDVVDRQLAIVRLLVENGADVNAKMKNDKIPLTILLDKYDYYRVKLHEEQMKASDFNDYPASSIAAAKRVAQSYLIIAKFLIEKGADVNAKMGTYGKTMLHNAALAGNRAKVKVLVGDLGADVNLQDNEGNTPLHEAAHAGHDPIIKFLLENGADINALNKANKTPLDKAVKANQKRVASLLKEEGALNGSAVKVLKDKYGKDWYKEYKKDRLKGPFGF